MADLGVRKQCDLCGGEYTSAPGEGDTVIVDREDVGGLPVYGRNTRVDWCGGCRTAVGAAYREAVLKRASKDAPKPSGGSGVSGK